MRGTRVFPIALGLALVGCGYQWVRYGGALGDVRSVAVETLRNDSYEPGLELMVTEALVREFMRRGAVELAAEPGGADLILSGSVLPVETRGRSFSSLLFALEYQVVLRVDLEARRPDGTKVPIDPTILRESELYLASADVEASRKNREEVFRRLARVLASRVHDALAEQLAP